VPAEQEVRFAVVMYGGVSLAIYMNGIAQELLRVVRATSGLGDTELSGTELVYRKLGRGLHLNRPVGEPLDDSRPGIRTRVVVDILSGTSAGGINAVFLAKALALGSVSLNALAELWKTEGDIDKLLNDRGSELDLYRSRKPATSLLNSQRMYAKLFDAMDAMEETPRSGEAPMASEIDLFVTATDLHGIYKPIELADSTPEERLHRMVFHFRCESADVAALRDATAENQFTSAYNPMLAFAARCTSSFPGAFEPMKLDDIATVRPEVDLTRKEVTDFFARYAKQGETPQRTRTRLFADGGYLDNRPFSYPIDAISSRDATIPVQRKLLILDPFPEYSDREHSSLPLRDVNFTENLFAAATTLPRYETIRDDIERLQRRNRTIAEVTDLELRVASSLHHPGVAFPDSFATLYLDELIQFYGPGYRPYHHLRVIDTTRQLATLVTRLARLNLDSDEAWAIRQIIEVWRADRYNAESGAVRGDGGPKRSESGFLNSFDYEFRIRRLNHIRMLLSELLSAPEPATEDLLQLQLVFRRNFARVSRLADRLAADTQVMPLLSQLADAIRPRLRAILRGTSNRKQRDCALKVIGDIGFDGLDRTALAIEQSLAVVFRTLRDEIMDAFDPENPQHEFLLEAYREFPYRDAIVYPVLRGTGADEAAEVQVFRVGPVEATLTPNANAARPDQKLAGIGLGAFAGFLSRQWRENDILWGRLDGADRIISALLPDPADAAERERLIGETRVVILEEELGANKKDGLMRALACWLRDELGSESGKLEKVKVKLEELLQDPADPVAALFNRALSGPGYERFMRLYYRMPDGPSTEDQLALLGRSLTIFSAMLERVGEGSGLIRRAVRLISFFGSLVLTTLSLATGITGRYVQRTLLAIALGALAIALLATFLPADAPRAVHWNWVWAIVFFSAAGLIEWLRRLVRTK
jgi:patatin-related protein